MTDRFSQFDNESDIRDLYEGIINLTEERSGYKILGENREQLLDVLLTGVDLHNLDKKITYCRENGVAPKLLIQRIIERGGENVARIFSQKISLAGN